MKKKILLTFMAVFFLGIGVAAFAYNTAGTAGRTAMSCCCCHGDSCPMKSKDSATGEKASCCDNCDCCKGDSCPMKKKGDATQAPNADAKDNKADAKSCDCPCCHHNDKDKETKDTPPV